MYPLTSSKNIGNQYITSRTKLVVVAFLIGLVTGIVFGCDIGISHTTQYCVSFAGIALFISSLIGFVYALRNAQKMVRNYIAATGIPQQFLSHVASVEGTARTLQEANLIVLADIHWDPVNKKVVQELIHAVAQDGDRLLLEGHACLQQAINQDYIGFKKLEVLGWDCMPVLDVAHREIAGSLHQNNSAYHGIQRIGPGTENISVRNDSLVRAVNESLPNRNRKVILTTGSAHMSRDVLERLAIYNFIFIDFYPSRVFTEAEIAAFYRPAPAAPVPSSSFSIPIEGFSLRRRLT